MEGKTYICCDLKSFCASVECMEQGLDPMTTNLVVADLRRTEKTICLAVTPSLKAYGISGRARLFEVVQRVKEVNAERQRKAPGHKLTGSSSHDPDLKAHPELALDYIVAPPRMAHYIEYSTKIFEVYLKYIAPEDIHSYSIDEVFMDVSNYLDTYKMTARELARTIILDVLNTTGITAAAGIGTNLYLAKVAMDIMAKRVPPDADGVRIAELDEMGYRQSLWSHRPLTDFWRVGRGYARRLEAHGLFTMGDIARCSIGKSTEDLLYKLFGVNAELLIDHAVEEGGGPISFVQNFYGLTYPEAVTRLLDGEHIRIGAAFRRYLSSHGVLWIPAGHPGSLKAISTRLKLVKETHKGGIAEKSLPLISFNIVKGCDLCLFVQPDDIVWRCWMLHIILGAG